MMKNLTENIVIALAVLFWWINRCHAQGQNCEYRYTRQPPTELTCNPYDPINRLALTCSVEGPNTPIFSIIWFRRRTGTTNDEELQASQSRVYIDVTQTIPAQFTRRSSRLTLIGLNEVSDVGEYWCQVRLENGTMFLERSSTLTLRNDDSYRTLIRCSGSSVVDKTSCLRVMQIYGPTVTDGGTSTNPRSVEWTISSSDISTSPQTTGGPINETEDNNGRNLVVIYAIIAVIVMASVIVLLLLIVLATVRCNQQETKTFPNKYEESQSSQSELREMAIVHQCADISTVNQDEYFDFKENSAYNTVGRIILNVNVSYVTTVPPRPNVPQEYEVFVPSTTE